MVGVFPSGASRVCHLAPAKWFRRFKGVDQNAPRQGEGSHSNMSDVALPQDTQPMGTPRDPQTPGAPYNAERRAEWFYTQRGKCYGPVTARELSVAAHLGFIGPEDMVLRKGDTCWRSAKSIPGLFRQG